MDLTEAGQDLPSTDAESLERLRRFGGGRLLNQMITLFLEAAPDRIAAARAGLTAGDAKPVEMALHPLKSSAAQLGALRLQRLCERGETSARAGSLAKMDSLMDEISDELTRVRVWLEGARNPETA